MSQPDLTAEDLARIHPGWWAVLASEGEWLPFEHLQLLCRKLIEVATGKVKRLIVVMPPQHGKSETTSRWFSSWFLGAFPDRRVILASYGAEFASEWGAKSRDALATFGPQVFGVQPRGGQKAARSHWEIETTQGKLTGGAFYAAGAGGPIVGRRADLAIIDDPHKGREDAFSPTQQVKIHEWYRSVLRTRLSKDAGVVLVQTRWHENDLAGRLLAEEGGDTWEVLHLRAIAVEGEPDPLGREPGEALCEALKPLSWLETTKAELGSALWAALYQGSPSPLGGGMFKADWVRYFEQPAPGLLVYEFQGFHRRLDASTLHRFLVCDLATSTRTSADFTVIQAWAVGPMGELLLLDQHRARMEGPDIVPALRAMADKHRVSSVWIEKAGFQLSLIQQARREGLPVRELRPDRDKVARALPATAAMEGGRVFFPRRQWITDTLLPELLAFPAGKHDDQVDVLSYAIEVGGQLGGGPAMPPRTGDDWEIQYGSRDYGGPLKLVVPELPDRDDELDRRVKEYLDYALEPPRD